MRGTKGSITATLGSILPSFLIILAIAMLFTGYQDNPTVIRIFKGIRPVVVALIASPMINMARRSNKKWWAWGLTAASIILVAFLKISPIYILVTTIIVAVLVSHYRNTRTDNKESES